MQTSVSCKWWPVKGMGRNDWASSEGFGKNTVYASEFSLIEGKKVNSSGLNFIWLLFGIK